MTPFEMVLQRYKFPEKVGEIPFIPVPLQIAAINEQAPLPGEGHWHDMGCVDSETEYLTTAGWKKISEYIGGRVAQYLPDSNSITFVEPSEYVKRPCDSMVEIRTKYGLNQRLSSEHRALLVEARGRRREVVSAASLLERHDAWVENGTPRIQKGQIAWMRLAVPTTFSVPGGGGLPLSNEQLRVMIAVVADGHFPNGSNTVVVRLKKLRKIRRLHQLLTTASIDYRCRAQDTETVKGFQVFSFTAPMKTKVFDEQWWQATPLQLSIVCDEVMHWDGSVSVGKPSARFSTMQKASADFVQYAFVACGRNARVNVMDRGNKGVEYSVQVRSTGRPLMLASLSSDGDRRPVMRAVPSTDGFKYCFTVPSTFLVFRRQGCVFASGNTGKTFIATACALYHKIQFGNRVLVIMPPLLLKQWHRWLKTITPALHVVRYEGTPKERAAMDITGADFVLVGIQIFKKEYQKFVNAFANGPYTVIVDEAHQIIANIDTDAHEKVYDFHIGHPVLLLTGTPATDPMHGYAMVKFTAPGTYRNKKQFENLHVEDRDFFGNPSKFRNLDQLATNMMKNAARIKFSDMHSSLQEPLPIPMPYDLAREHMKLYRKLAEEELLKVEGGGKIDATTENKLTHNLGQLIVNWGFFANDPKLISNAIYMIEEKLEELGDGRLLVFGHYRMTAALVAKYFGARCAGVINGDATLKQRERSKDRFLDDAQARMMFLQTTSGGTGLDGLQHVCNTALFIELPQRPGPYRQAVGRLNRLGQANRVRVYLGSAEGTLQVRAFKNLLKNDETANQVVSSATDLRAMIYGD